MKKKYDIPDEYITEERGVLVPYKHYEKLMKRHSTAMLFANTFVNFMNVGLALSSLMLFLSMCLLYHTGSVAVVNLIAVCAIAVIVFAIMSHDRKLICSTLSKIVR